MSDQIQMVKTISKLFEEKINQVVAEDLPKYTTKEAEGCTQIVTVARYLFKYFTPVRKLASSSIATTTGMSLSSGFCSVKKDVIVDKFMTWLAAHPLMKNNHIFFGSGLSEDGKHIAWEYGPYPLYEVIAITRSKPFGPKDNTKYSVGRDYVNLLWGAFGLSSIQIIHSGDAYNILATRRI